MESLLDVCPHGAWLSEEHAVEFLGLPSKSSLKEAFLGGNLPHVIVDHGKRFGNVSEPFSKRRFFFIRKEGQPGSRPSIKFASWVGICESLAEGNVDALNSAARYQIRDYTNNTNMADAYEKLKRTRGIISPSELTGEDSDDGYRYGSNGGLVRSRSKASEGEIFTKANGQKVRRVKRSSASHNRSGSKDGPRTRSDESPQRGVRRSASLQPMPTSKGDSLAGFLSKDRKEKARPRSSGSRSVGASSTGARSTGDRSAGAAEGQIYTRPDGTKVRRVGKSASLSSIAASEAASQKKASLSGFLDDNSKPNQGSASVAGDQIAISKESSVTGEIYVRADGTRVRRVKKPAPSSDDSEIITRADGTRFRRVRRVKPKPQSASPSQPTKATKETTSGSSTTPSKNENTGNLSGFLSDDKPSPSKASPFSGSHSVAGDQYTESEINIRADGKKVKRVAKTQPGDIDPNSLSGFLDEGTANKPKSTGPATVVGDTNPHPEVSDKPEQEIYVRPDGKKVLRIRKSTFKSSSDHAKAPSLGGFLQENESETKGKPGQSHSVAGDQIAVGKEQSLTGEIYVRADGKKVRRVRKQREVTPGSEDANVEIYTRADGTRVRRIRKTKPASPVGSSELSSLIESQSKPGLGGGAATVSGRMIGKGATLSSAATVSGSMNNVTKEGSVATVSMPIKKELPPDGEIYTREDGKKVRRVKKSIHLLPGDQVEIITRPDGTKFRRVKRAKQPKGPNPVISESASVTGDIAEGEVYIRADGKKVRKVRKTDGSRPVPRKSTSTPSLSDQYEIYIRPDGKKVRRIKRSVKLAAQSKAGHESELSLSAMLARNEGVTTSFSSATVTGYNVSAKSSSKDLPEPVLSKEAPSTSSEPKCSSIPTDENPAVEKSAAGKQAVEKADTGTDRKTSSLSPAEEEIATPYRKMLKMHLPEGAVIQKMSVEGVAQHIQDSVLAQEEPSTSSTAPAVASQLSIAGEDDGVTLQQNDSVANQKDGLPEADKPDNRQGYVTAAAIAVSAPVPEGMALVQKDAAVLPDGMVLVPKEQADKMIPEGMIAIPKEKAGEGIPEGYVLVPKDQVRGDPGDDLILVKKDQIKDEASPYIIYMGPDKPSPMKERRENYDDVDISSANIVSMDDLPNEVKKMRQNENGSRPRFLLQALPEDKEMEDDFIRKNLLPASSTPQETKPSPPKKAAQSSSVAEVLAQMSSMGGEFDAQKMQELLEKLETAEERQKTAEKRQKKLEKQLAAVGVAIAEDIDYDICVKKVDEIGKRMNAIGGSDVTHPDKKEQNRLREEYFKLEQEMEKYNSALLITDEYVAEQNRIEKKWEEDNAPSNMEALKRLRRHLPVEVRNMSEAQLANEPSPNGKYLPKSFAKKFKRTNVLQIIRRDPDDIVRMHPSTLENMRVTGMTLTERRAVYEHLRSCGPKWYAQKADKMTERKWTWFKMMKDNFKENLAAYNRHVAQYGPPGAHPYATRANPNEGCPLIGKQCPLKADKTIDYEAEDYGYTDEAVYEVSVVQKADVEDQGAKAMAEAMALMKEKKANERSDTLKKHYKGKLLNVAKANGSCESMDEIVEKMDFGMTSWIEAIINGDGDVSKLTDEMKKKEVVKIANVLNEIKTPILDVCARSGMQTSGKRTDDEKPDPRSIVECCLAEETLESFEIFGKYVNDRLKEIGVADTRIKSTINMLKSSLDELHQRNVKTIKDLGPERIPRSRKLKTRKDIEDAIKEKAKASEPEAAAEEATGPPLPGPPRGGLMDAIKGGRGGGRGGLLDSIQGRGRGGRGGGRGGLMDAIQGRGRGGGRGGLMDAIQGRGRGGGRGGLMDAIQGRGRGGGGRGGLLDAIQGRGRGGGGGRGGLLDAIQGRGRGGGGGGGRGGLMDAIKARGGGEGGGRGDAGGRGGLMAAIQARGGGGD